MKKGCIIFLLLFTPAGPFIIAFYIIRAIVRAIADAVSSHKVKVMQKKKAQLELQEQKEKETLQRNKRNFSEILNVLEECIKKCEQTYKNEYELNSIKINYQSMQIEREINNITNMCSAYERQIEEVVQAKHI